MNEKSAKNKQKLSVQLIRSYLERFRYVSSMAWIISTGSVTLASALVPTIWPKVDARGMAFIYASILVVSIILAFVFKLFRPTLSQQLIEAKKHYAAGGVAFDNQDYPTACEEYGLAYQKDPNSFIHASKYGRLLMRNGDYKSAVQVLTQAADLSSTDYDRYCAIRNRGIAAMCNQDWPQALRDFIEYIEKKSKPEEYAPVLRMLALVELQTRDFISAEDHAKNAVGILREKASVHSTYSIVLARNDMEKAKKEFSFACKHISNDGDDLYALAQASVVHEDINQAYDRLKKAVSIDPKFRTRALKDPLFDKLKKNRKRFNETINSEEKELGLESID